MYYYAPFYSVEKKIPVNHYLDVSVDNLQFTNDQKIYSAAFSDFIEKLLTNANKMKGKKY